jgi:hypothetical protein
MSLDRIKFSFEHQSGLDGLLSDLSRGLKKVNPREEDSAYRRVQVHHRIHEVTQINAQNSAGQLAGKGKKANSQLNFSLVAEVI